MRGVQHNWFPCVTPIFDPQEKFDPVAKQLFGPDAKPPIAPAPVPSMRGFLQNYYDSFTDKLDITYLQILDTYDRHQLPVINSLARNYAVSDRWFCSIPSQTSINRAFSICGNSMGWKQKEDKGNKAKRLGMVNNHYYTADFEPALFSEICIWEALCHYGHNSEADWRIYYSSGWPPAPFVKGAETSYTYQMFHSLQHALNSQIKSPKDKMYKKIEDFYADAREGDLPAFTYLEPDYSVTMLGKVGHQGNDYHPPADVKPAEDFLRKIYKAVTTSPCWGETLLIISFDEHGGTFDHVAPPWHSINPDPSDVPGEDGFKFNRLGVRVPTIFVSPWIRENTVIRSDNPDTPFDHTSFLATLINWWGMTTLMLGKRVDNAPTFEEVITDTKRSTVPRVPADWDCKHSSELATDGDLTISTAAHVAHILAASHEVSEMDAMKDILRKCKTLSDLASYHEKYCRKKK